MKVPGTGRFDDLTYERFRLLILERSGLHFPDKRRHDLERGLAAALAASGRPDIEDYYRLLSSRPTAAPEWEQLLSQVTIGETYFFRDRGQFEALRQHVLPEIIDRKRGLGRQMRIWCAGCASGEEPYSIAMVLRELLPNLESWGLTILATDINREAIKKARAGCYSDWSFREEGWERMRERYFRRDGKHWELAPGVRDMVTFAYLNLGEDPYPSMANNTVAFDLIVCRNVTIYFSPELVQEVVDRMHEALVDGGWLVVGHAEPSPLTYAQFEGHTFPGAILYQKTGRPARFDLSWLQKVEGKPAALAASPPAVPPAAPAGPPPALPAPAPTAPPKKAPPAAVSAPPPAPARTCDEVRALLEQGHMDEALEQLHGLIERDPGCASAYLLAGKIRANAGRWEEARRWCEQALQLDPLLTEAHFLLSLVYSQVGESARALESMKHVVYLERGSAIGHFCLANLYQEAGKGSRARKSLENAAHLLQGMPAETVIPWSDGMTAGRLLYTVRRQMEE